MARILVVDDETSMQEFLRILLQRDGHDVTACGSATEALIALESDDWDLVISDVRMPGMSGLDLLDQVLQAVLRTHGPAAVVERGCKAVNADLHQDLTQRRIAVSRASHAIAAESSNDSTNAFIGRRCRVFEEHVVRNLDGASTARITIRN